MCFDLTVSVRTSPVEDQMKLFPHRRQTQISPIFVRFGQCIFRPQKQWAIWCGIVLLHV